MYGLKEETIHSIRDLFRKHKEIEEVIIYGSRAKNTQKDGSDIDLTFKGHNLSLTLLNKISNELDDLILPYLFDLSLYSDIKNEELIAHIKRAGKLFYARER